MQNILSEHRDPMAAVDADTATFYSISNCQTGLAGISFGNSLIKTVVQYLLRDVPQIKYFVTLSPILAGQFVVGASVDAQGIPQGTHGRGSAQLCADYAGAGPR